MKVTAEQIQEWKNKYGDVYHFPVEDKECYLRSPNMVDFKRAFTAMQKDGDVAFGEELLGALWLEGDEKIKTVDDYFLPARKKLMDFFNYEDAEIEKEGSKFKITIGEETCIVRVITRNDLKIAERKNPSGKPFVTQEKLFEMVVIEKAEAFADKNNAEIRFPLYKAIETLQNGKVAMLKKL